MLPMWYAKTGIYPRISKLIFPCVFKNMTFSTQRTCVFLHNGRILSTFVHVRAFLLSIIVEQRSTLLNLVMLVLKACQTRQRNTDCWGHWSFQLRFQDSQLCRKKRNNSSHQSHPLTAVLTVRRTQCRADSFWGFWKVWWHFWCELSHATT